jgi:hypothetical protein
MQYESAGKRRDGRISREGSVALRRAPAHPRFDEEPPPSIRTESDTNPNLPFTTVAGTATLEGRRRAGSDAVKAMAAPKGLRRA